MFTGNRDLIKQINQSITLNLIKRHGPVSRTDIARLSGLSPATISGLTARLMDSGFIHEVGEGEPTKGRRPILLNLNPRGGFVVGVKLTEQSITSVVADLEANVIQCRLTSVRGMGDPQAAITAVSQAIEATLDESDLPRGKVMGIGIGLAGIIDSHAGECRYSPTLNWHAVELVRPLEDRLRLPVHVDNDVNTLTIAEQWFGIGHNVENFLLVTIGRGVGMGVVANGQIYRGHFGGAGEFGHITLEDDGPLCGCGKRGCLEAFVADYAMARMAREAVEAGRATTLASVVGGLEHLTIARVAEAAQAGDSVALDIVTRAGRALGRGFSYLLTLFDPQMVILSGEGACAGELLIGPARESMHALGLGGLEQELLMIEPVGEETWARGAACVVLSELFQHPIHRGGRAFSWSTY